MGIPTKAIPLKEELEQTIQESGLNFGEVYSVLEFLVASYRDKGMNLLNGTSIQEVADRPRFSRAQKP